ncbi:MAG: immune inhibitor A [Anaerolineales bacterium]|nr:immune inhibitor A [Anaerolineales bacterium]
MVVRRVAVLVLLSVMVAACGASPEPALVRGPLPRPTPAAPQASEPVPGETLATMSTLAQLQSIHPPLRDTRGLVERLDPDLRSVPAVVRTVAPVRTLGDQDKLWVHNTSDNTNVAITATLVYSTPVVYVWIEDGQPYDEGAIRTSVDRFSNTIYPREIGTFGSEWYPGIDADPRLHILYTTATGPGVAGYFYSTDLSPQAASPFSNEREMFYINLDNLNFAHNDARHETTLAHELQHMIHWHMDRGEDLWINEGLAEYAQEVAGYPPDTLFVNSFANDPDLQLTGWGTMVGANGPHYGAAYLFVAYLAQRFGEPFLTALVAAPANGLAGVDAALRQVGAHTTAEAVFADWVVANYAQQPDALGDGGIYGYRNRTLPPFRTAVTFSAYPVTNADGVMNFGTDYLELNGQGDLTFRFEGSPTTHVVPVNLPEGERVWWSNRADDSNTRLTRRFDLGAVAQGSPVTLTASMWYDIEEGYDYGYVMASRDGEHWAILPGQRTQTDNPSGNAFGPGYTGQSTQEPSVDAVGPGDWITETYDLSGYAGGPLWLQFNYMTDDAANSPGWLIRNIQIAAADGPIASSEGATIADGWASEGWILTDNQLPQRWLVQVLEFDRDKLVNVRRIPIDAVTGKGQFDINDLNDQRRAVVAISGLTPVTSAPAEYAYQIEQR